MTTEGGTTNFKSPLGGMSSSAAASDDEISVIAVIKKGTSGIPKRARYHYIRELPLASVKSLKKSLQKVKDRRTHVRVSLPENEASVNSNEGSIKLSNDTKRPRVIELGDETSKMELRKQFKITEKVSEENEETVRTEGQYTPPTVDRHVMHKLPPGTVLIKQEPRTPAGVINSPRNQSGNNNNGSSAGTTTSTTSNSTSSASSSASSCGSGSSSGGFGSGSASPATKVKRLHRAQKTASRKKNVQDVVPRRNPKRCGSKKNLVATSTTTTCMTTRPRQRQRLLTTRTQQSEVLTGKRTRPATMPYMNTRSVTRKLYTVGATYQAPTRKDETEWREWPVHGMHERPVFHPQIGLAAAYAGRVFWTTTDENGLNSTYREVLDPAEEVEVVPVDPRPKGNATSPTGSAADESFEVCMHESLHSVLAYCAQVMAPDYRRKVGKKLRYDGDAEAEASGQFSVRKDGDAKTEVRKIEPAETTQLNLTELEDSSISDETLMAMSSIYKKLLPVEDQPSSREDSPLRKEEKSPAQGNNSAGKKIDEDRLAIAKNSNEVTEIAKILSEYNGNLKEKGLSRNSVDHLKLVTTIRDSFAKDVREKLELDFEKPEAQEKTSKTGKKPDVDEDFIKSNVSKKPTILNCNKELQKSIPEKSMNSQDNWLENLLVDTSLLYCVATGVRQSDLTQYVDSLDAKQSLQWLRHRDG